MDEQQSRTTPSMADNQIVQAANSRARLDWAATAQEMVARGDDALIDQEAPTAFDEEEWEW